MKNTGQIKSVILIVLLMVAQLVRAQDKKDAPNQSDKKFTIENCVNQFTMDNTNKTNTGYTYWFADKDFIDGRTIKMSVVSPNLALHGSHTHTEDEFFFILEGKARFYLDGKTVIVGPYTSLYCPSGIEHGISNAGDTELKYLVIKKVAE